MKKFLPAFILISVLVSCDYILKERDTTEAEVNTEEKIVLGNDRDDKGCVTSAGYKWSLLNKECIRVFEEGYRLNTIDSLKAEDITAAAFVVFDKEQEQAELYLPNEAKSILMKKEADGLYKSGVWSLHTRKNYQLKKQNRVVFAGAVIQENKVISDDWKGGDIAPAQPAAKDSVATAPITP